MWPVKRQQVGRTYASRFSFVFLSFFLACIAFYELTHFHGHVELPANHVTSSRKTCTCVCVRKSVNGTLEKLAQLSLGLVEMARCIRWQHLRRFECVSFGSPRHCLRLCFCLCCLPCSSNMTARKGGESYRGVGSRQGWLQQCNTKYYKSSAKLLPNSSMRSKQGIFLFLLHVCGNPATRNSHPSPLALLVKSNLLHTFVRRSKTATKCIRPARQLQL